MEVGIVIADIWETVKGDQLLGLLVTIGFLALIANQVIGMIRHFRPQWIRGSVITSDADEWATKAEVKKLESSVHNQLTEMRAYLHTFVHENKNDMQGHFARSDLAREKIYELIAKEGRRQDARTNDILAEVSKLRGAFDESRRRHARE